MAAKKEKKEKSLTVSSLTTHSKELDKKDSVMVYSNLGEAFKLDIYKKFKHTKKVECLADMMNTFKRCTDAGIEIEKIMREFLILMVIKHFTSLGETIPEDPAKFVDVLTKLIDLELLTKIFEELDQYEVNELINMFLQVVTETKEYAEITAEIVNAMDNEDEDEWEPVDQ